MKNLSPKQLEQRRTNVAAIAAARREATHCLRRHEFTPENTYIFSDGRRQCKTCKVDSNFYRKHGYNVSY